METSTQPAVWAVGGFNGQEAKAYHFGERIRLRFAHEPQMRETLEVYQGWRKQLTEAELCLIRKLYVDMTFGVAEDSRTEAPKSIFSTMAQMQANSTRNIMMNWANLQQATSTQQAQLQQPHPHQVTANHAPLNQQYLAANTYPPPVTPQYTFSAFHRTPTTLHTSQGSNNMVHNSQVTSFHAGGTQTTQTQREHRDLQDPKNPLFKIEILDGGRTLRVLSLFPLIKEQIEENPSQNKAKALVPQVGGDPKR